MQPGPWSLQIRPLPYAATLPARPVRLYRPALRPPGMPTPSRTIRLLRWTSTGLPPWMGPRPRRSGPAPGLRLPRLPRLPRPPRRRSWGGWRRPLSPPLVLPPRPQLPALPILRRLVHRPPTSRRMGTLQRTPTWRLPGRRYRPPGRRSLGSPPGRRRFVPRRPRAPQTPRLALARRAGLLRPRLRRPFGLRDTILSLTHTAAGDATAPRALWRLLALAVPRVRSHLGGLRLLRGSPAAPSAIRALPRRGQPPPAPFVPVVPFRGLPVLLPVPRALPPGGPPPPRRA